MTVIDDYLQHVDGVQRAELERLRLIVKHCAPDAKEVISYGMPAFTYKKKYLIGFAAYANHMGIYPTPEPIEILKDKLTEYKLTKGTIQFTSEHPLSESVIKDLVAVRIAEIDK